MSSTSETCHAKIVANYEKLIASITALGTPYNLQNFLTQGTQRLHKAHRDSQRKKWRHTGF